MHLIDGKALATAIQTEVAERIKSLSQPPGLAVLLVGEDKASHLYVSLKKKRAEAAGIKIEVLEASAATSDTELMHAIQAWNQRPDIHGVLVQIPLPSNHDENAIIAAINPKKDVDGFHPESIKALAAHAPSFVPPVHEGILRLIAATPLDLVGKTAIIIANSSIFADPLVQLLKSVGLFVHTFQPDELEAQTLRRADVIVIAIGRAKFLHAGMTKKTAVIIDVGTNHDENGNLCGDVDIATYAPYATWISPVPGGVGPMTIALLLLNVVRAATSSLHPSVANQCSGCECG